MCLFLYEFNREENLISQVSLVLMIHKWIILWQSLAGFLCTKSFPTKSFFTCVAGVRLLEARCHSGHVSGGIRGFLCEFHIPVKDYSNALLPISACH